MSLENNMSATAAISADKNQPELPTTDLNTVQEPAELLGVTNHADQTLWRGFA
jgi:hypothetical protein